MRLERPCEIEEVGKVVECSKDKACDSDGFTMAIFHVCREKVKNDLIRVFGKFFQNR